MKIHRSLHPPAGAGDRRQPGHSDRRIAVRSARSPCGSIRAATSPSSTVTTAYVGANADLVRGFITTPLERVIASADGIDYIESSSAQGLSTITVHLKLNYDTNAALTQIQSKVAQVRNHLPPEAEAPIIELETADSQFAAVYLGFSSSDLDQNQITDYLDARRAAEAQRDQRRAARRHLRRPHVRDAGLAQARADGGARHLAFGGARRARGRTTISPRSARTKGSMMSVNLVANTDLQHRRGVPPARRQGGERRRSCASATSPTSCSAPRTTTRTCGSTARTPPSWASGCCPTANTLDVMQARARGDAGDPGAAAGGMKAASRTTRRVYIQDAIHEVLKTLTETLLIVIVVIFLFLGSVRSVIIPVVAIPISLIGAVS